MATYRSNLPQVAGHQLFLADGGMETDLIFNRGVELPVFSSLVMHTIPGGEDTLREYFAPYFRTARENNSGFIMETSTWRASRDWAEALGMTEAELGDANTRAVTFFNELRASHDSADMPVVVSGCIGPRGDGYDAGRVMSVDEASSYHAWQVKLFRDAGADLVTGMTMTNIPEAIGMVDAAKANGMPIVISFTVETDGTLPAGDRLEDAINAVDQATDGYVAYFMVNCAHPDHFSDVLDPAADWTKRILGLRANASRCSHEELDNSTELDDGNPVELGTQYADLLARLPQLKVFGGCCGTDHRHVKEIANAVFADKRRAA